jgi:hypothetical protein
MIVTYLISLALADNNNTDDKIFLWYLTLAYAHNNMMKNMMYNISTENTPNP